MSNYETAGTAFTAANHDHEQTECGCGCAHGQSQNKTGVWLLGAGILLAAVSVLFSLSAWVYGIAYLLCSYQILWQALKNIAKGKIFDENFLMAIASLGAFALGEYLEAIAVIVFYSVGELLQEYAVQRSKRSITALMDIRPDFAVLLQGDVRTRVTPQTVAVGDVIEVKAGEKIPLDGVILSGNGLIDTSALTGESVPVHKAQGEPVLSGSINTSGTLTISVTSSFGESTVSKIIDMVQNASNKKSSSEKFISRFAKVYTPIVVIGAALLAFLPPLILGWDTFSVWSYRALSFLVISCPCALVVSIPVTFFAGIGGASANNILVKGANYLEALKDVNTIAFDKTGTLTKGVFEVQTVRAQQGVAPEALEQLASIAQAQSNHPIAQSIIRAFGAPAALPKQFQEIAGYGVLADDIVAGNAKLMQQQGIDFVPAQDVGSIVYIAQGGVYQGYICIADEIKPNVKKALQGLHALGIRKTVLLTGDNEAVAQTIAQQLDIQDVRAQLLPQDKVGIVESLLHEQGAKVAFVGDGINDAPVLARADIGVSMGMLGSDAAIEASDVVLMNDDLNSLAIAIGIARKTDRIAKQNIVFSLGVKLVFLSLGALGITSLWLAIFADVGVALIAIANAMRARFIKKTA